MKATTRGTRWRNASLLLLASCASCARGPSAWRAALVDPESDAFDRGLAAIALAEAGGAELEGVAPALLSTIDVKNSSLASAARSALLALPATALPELTRCLVQESTGNGPGGKALEAAIIAHGAAAIPPLLDAMPEVGTRGAVSVNRVVSAIGGPAAPPLARELRAADRGVKAAFLLKGLGSQASSAIDALLLAAQGESRDVALASIDALTRVNPEGVRIEPVLRKLAAGHDPDLRAASEEGLARIFLERARKLDPDLGEKQRLELLRDAMALDSRSVPAFTEGLWPEGSVAARFASDVLLGSALRWSLMSRTLTTSAAELRDAEKRLLDGRLRDRRSAALEIGRMGRAGAGAFPALAHALEVDDWGLRFCLELACALIVVDLVRG